MPTFLTLTQISEKLQTSLLHSRTDFLLQQAELWKKLNNAGRESNVFVKPETLDLAQTKFEFFIAPEVKNPLVRVYQSILGISQTQTRFRLCGNDQKNSIKVSIEIRLQAGQQLKPEINTEPKTNLIPEKTHVTGLTF
jgi:hypothetical protein